MPQGVWAYLRVSTAKGEQELSLEEQERWAREHASGLGETLQLFPERASAKSVIGRPVFQKLIAELEGLPSAKRPKQIAVTSFDRLYRDMTDTLVVARTLRSLKVDLYVRNVGVVKADTFAQRAALVGQSMGGEAENEARSSRIKASWERRKREGKPTSNKVPYGLQRVRLVCIWHWFAPHCRAFQARSGATFGPYRQDRLGWQA
jgi:DNA invertase Pin-like site-specific DNA recombinase